MRYRLALCVVAAAAMIVLAACQPGQSTPQNVALAKWLNRPVAGHSVPCPQWLGASRIAGFSETEVLNMNYFMFRESRCDPRAYQFRYNNDGLPDWCLLQIHQTWQRTLVSVGVIKQSMSELFNPQVCMNAARYLFVRDGYHPWD